MSDEPKQNYTGTPVQVGASLASDALHPTIQKTIEDGVTDQQLMGMLTGMVLFVVGMAAMAVSPEEAEKMLRNCLKHLADNPPAAPSH